MDNGIVVASSLLILFWSICHISIISASIFAYIVVSSQSYLSEFEFSYTCVQMWTNKCIYIYTPLSLSHLFSLTINTRQFFWWNVVNHWKTRVLRVPLNHDQRNGITWNYQLMHIIQLRLLYITRTTAKKKDTYIVWNVFVVKMLRSLFAQSCFS